MGKGPLDELAASEMRDEITRLRAVEAKCKAEHKTPKESPLSVWILAIAIGLLLLFVIGALTERSRW